MDQETKQKPAKKVEEEVKKSSTGLEENVGGVLAYLLGFISGIAFLLIEKENENVRFHAMQSVILFGFLFVLVTVLNVIPVIGWMINILIAPISLLLWIVLMEKAYQGERYHLPISGKIAERQLQKMAE
ncbi:DUF4870 domain-containing protein [Halobacillus litoralis]|uniref:DUF4870 domain-containing protein n=1 Tax=Halobacillus litoralis TaxID=45668 RepID=A0A410MBP4_9BACI|nr:DUF4870 domain-containing protein [Halobacillus litoralis]QAS52103.1 hypothetical protein HLI_07630 [Halobacillus litoralis]